MECATGVTAEEDEEREEGATRPDQPARLGGRIGSRGMSRRVKYREEKDGCKETRLKKRSNHDMIVTVKKNIYK